MAEILRSLSGNIPTLYTVFDADQVLTHDQLNGLAAYLDDQQRLTRVTLLGVGIVCGLQVSIQDGGVRLTKGVGVTTDGDLLYALADALYPSYRRYGADAPDYEPFMVSPGGPRIAAWELVLTSTGDPPPDVFSIDQFDTREGRTFADMVAVLLAESYVKPQDLCTGTDCDNLGGTSRHAMKLIVIDASSVSRFRGGLDALATPEQIARDLVEVVAARATVPGVSSTQGLVGAYRSAGNATALALDGAFRGFSDRLSRSTLFADFRGDLPREWAGLLVGITESYRTSSVGIQYYYDFLKDVAETWNALRDQLFDIKSVCCPDVGAFPKHLVLGGLRTQAALDLNRVGFYPSPLVGESRERYAHARFLFAKLDAIVRAFRVPEVNEIRVTPSLFEEYELERRAIPYYYDPGRAPSVRDGWSFALTQRGMSDHNYSYHATPSNARGGAANPFGSQIGRFSFFRIEGHLGMTVNAALNFLNNRVIKPQNLPIAVVAVVLGPEQAEVQWVATDTRSPIRELYGITRNEVIHQAESAAAASERFAATAPPNVSRAMGDRARSLRDHATRLAGARSMNHEEFIAQSEGWRSEVATARAESVQFKMALGDAGVSSVAAVSERLIDTGPQQRLIEIERLIAALNNQSKEGLRFQKFLDDHPGMEHFAGVLRGGTFVLVYDESGRVVADFALPYRVQQAEAPRPEVTADPTDVPRPELSLPPEVFQLDPLAEVIVDQRITRFREEVVNPQIQSQRQQFQDFGSFIGNVIGQAPPLRTDGPPRQVTQPEIEARMREVSQLTTAIRELGQPENPTRATELANRQNELAGAIAFVIDGLAQNPALRLSEDQTRALETGAESVQRNATARRVASQMLSRVSTEVLPTRVGGVVGAIRGR